MNVEFVKGYIESKLNDQTFLTQNFVANGENADKAVFLAIQALEMDWYLKVHQGTRLHTLARDMK